MLVTDTNAIESPNSQAATNFYICLHSKGPTQETVPQNEFYIPCGIPFSIEFLCDIATKWTLAVLCLSHYAAESCFALISWGHSASASAYRPFLRDDHNERRFPARIPCFIKVPEEIPAGRIARGFLDTVPVSNMRHSCGQSNVYQVGNKWGITGELPALAGGMQTLAACVLQAGRSGPRSVPIGRNK
jgi:hypothetical protein